jgi:hypothetical protein
VDDFFVKPVRHSELLDWLGRRLQLQWLDHPAETELPPHPLQLRPTPTPTPTPIPTLSALPRDELVALQTLVQLGYYRGILNKLHALALSHPQCAAFTATQAALARQYQFETMQSHLQKALDEPAH